MSLEGRLRELAIAELLQLLGAGKKTGTLRISAALEGSTSEIIFDHGAIVDTRVREPAAFVSSAPQGTVRDLASEAKAERERVEACVLHLLTWTQGEFHFTASTLPPSTSLLRLPVEPLLVEAANRAQVWASVADRVSHGAQVPRYADAPDKISALRLTPREWDALSRVDGKLSIAEIALCVDKPLLELVQIFHGLIGHGLIALSEGTGARSAHHTPPSSVHVPVHDLFGHITSEATEKPGLEKEREETNRRADTSLISKPGDDAARNGDFLAAIAHWNSALDEISRSFGMHRMVEGSSHSRIYLTGHALEFNSRIFVVRSIRQPVKA